MFLVDKTATPAEPKVEELEEKVRDIYLLLFGRLSNKPADFISI